MNDNSNRDILLDFTLRQYEEHRRCLLAVAQEERQLERYVLLGCAGFYSWLATQSNPGLGFMAIASFMPTAIVLLSIVRMRALANAIRSEADYLRLLEAEIYRRKPKDYSGPLGWESYVRTNYDYIKRFESSEKVFWYALLGLTIIASTAFLRLRA